MTETRPSPRRDPLEQVYWSHVARHDLRLQCCASCGDVRYPPAPSCPRCGGETAEWRPLSGRGRVVAWTVFHRSYFPALPAPYAVVSVETAEGAMLVGNLIGAKTPTVGLAVRAVFQPARFDDGTDGCICQWEPADDDPQPTQGARP